MKLISCMIRVCLSHIRSWLSNYRIWCIAVLTLLIIHLFTKEIRSFVLLTNTQISMYLFPFLFTQKYVRLLFFLPLLLLFCDAPFLDINQPSIIYRSGRKIWCLGQVLYLWIASQIYFLFIMIGVILLNIRYIQFNGEWGKVLQTLHQTNARIDAGIVLEFPSQIFNYFSPPQAMFYSFLLLSISGFVLGLVIFFTNIVTNNRGWGIVVGSCLLIFDAIIKEGETAFWFSPISWNNIAKIGIGEGTLQPGILYIVTIYGILIISLTLVITLIFNKRDIEILPQI